MFSPIRANAFFFIFGVSQQGKIRARKLKMGLKNDIFCQVDNRVLTISGANKSFSGLFERFLGF